MNLTARAGSIHALVGKNGAGKSTLMKIPGSLYLDYGGEIMPDGRGVNSTGPRKAAAGGVAIIHQELSLLPTFPLAETIFLPPSRDPTGCATTSLWRIAP
ncbi:MAG TPA: ATP-binding cassette domain-containing protein [Blastocatellia bacterium]|nr:ATP-binding cassette domain-containing protein [Blastocatellia bacterium]